MCTCPCTYGVQRKTQLGVLFHSLPYFYKVVCLTESEARSGSACPIILLSLAPVEDCRHVSEHTQLCTWLLETILSHVW